MKLGDKVKLISFNGLKNGLQEIEEQENYWKLIGHTGTMMKYPKEKYFIGRVLIEFDIDVKSLNLECHNEVDNALWILEKDLEKLNYRIQEIEKLK